MEPTPLRKPNGRPKRIPEQTQADKALDVAMTRDELFHQLEHVTYIDPTEQRVLDDWRALCALAADVEPVFQRMLEARVARARGWEPAA